MAVEDVACVYACVIPAIDGKNNYYDICYTESKSSLLNDFKYRAVYHGSATSYPRKVKIMNYVESRSRIKGQRTKVTIPIGIHVLTEHKYNARNYESMKEELHNTLLQERQYYKDLYTKKYDEKYIISDRNVSDETKELVDEYLKQEFTLKITFKKLVNNKLRVVKTHTINYTPKVDNNTYDTTPISVILEREYAKRGLIDR